MVDVFVSYASEDRERVRGIVAAIEAIGCSVWWDRQIDAGAAFDREIEKAIDDAHCIVVVWSKTSIESEWVRTEANEGLEKGNLVPVAIESLRPPLAFRRIQTIDYTAPDANANLVAAIVRLLPTGEAGEGLPCVGRGRELERIGEYIERTRGGEGGLLLFSGEAGVGKTRLTYEAGRIAEADDFLVLRGHCADIETAPPYQPLLEQIEQGTRTLTSEQMRAALGENATEISRLMPELRQRFDDIPPYPSLPPEQERRYLLHGIGEFVARAATNRPLLLVFEDLHWADESTSILLRQLAERVKTERVLLIGTYRDSDLPANSPFGRILQELIRERLTEVLALSRLTRTELIELLVRRFAAEPPAALVDLIFSETEGNPFFIEEVIRHLTDVGKLLTDAGKFRDAVEIADTEVPRGVRLIIEDRVGRVSAPCREVLTLAAVSGRVFDFDLLAKADAKRDEDELLDAVEEAENRRLIEDASTDRIARYRFVHEQIRQTLLSSLSLPRRQRLHLRVADALEALHGSRADRIAGEIGHHLFNAGSAAEPARTARQLAIAGERAIDAFAFEDALRQFDLAASVLERSDDAAERARLSSLRAIALRGAGRIPEALDALQSAIATAPTSERRDGYVLQRCRLLLDIWRGSETIDDLEALLARAGERADPAWQLDVQSTIARAYYVMSLDRSGFAEKCRAAYERTIALAREQGAHKTLGVALVAAAQLVDYWPDYAAQARRNLDEAERLGREVGDEEIEIDAAAARLNVFADGDVDVNGEQLLQRLLRRRDPVRLNALYFRMMWATYGARALERCVEICDAGIELAYRIGAQPVQYPTIKAMALLELGRFGDAWSSLDEEVADDEHRFGVALQALGRLQYEAEVAAFDAVFERLPDLIAEAKFLNRAWMLQWIAATCAAMAPEFGDDEATLARLDELVASTDAELDSLQQAGFAVARGELERAETLLGADPTPSFRIVGVGLQVARLSLLAEVQSLRGQWDAARATTDDAIARARDRDMALRLCQLLARRARIERKLDANDQAEGTLTEALALQERIAATIPDAEHRRSFLEGRVAQRLGLAR